MRCSICNKRAVFYRKYEGRGFCRSHFLKSVEQRVSRTINQKALIDKNDHIAAAVSGGKDSLFLIYILKKLFAKRKDISLSALIVDEGIKGYRERSITKAKDLCEKLDMKLQILSFREEFGKTLDEIMKSRIQNSKAFIPNPCTFCGVFRRYIINKKAREIKATKLATGHNLDDESQSIMANYIKGDILRGARLGAKYTTKTLKFVPRIKPLRDIPEREIALYVLLKKIDADFGECPYASNSFRWTVRDMVNELENKYPGSKLNIVRTFDKIRPLLQGLLPEEKINNCKMCKEPSSRDICKACELKKFFKGA